MKILVIGSKGFIGSYCLNLFAVSGQEVWGCDVVTDYVNDRYVQIDATNSDFKEIFRKESFEVCINCSGAASVPDSFSNPLKDFSLNTYNVAGMLDAIRLYRPNCKFINLSSAAVYGNPATLPIYENLLLQPLSPYGLHKKQAEELVKEYAGLFKLNTCSLRLFSVYGPGLRKQLFWDLHVKIMKSANIELWGTGKESRDFIYVEDVVRAIQCVIEQAPFKGECINVANGNEINIQNIATLFRQLHFKPFDFSFSGEEHQGYPVNWRADITLLSNMHYTPAVTIEQGISNYIQWLKEEK